MRPVILFLLGMGTAVVLIVCLCYAGAYSYIFGSYPIDSTLISEIVSPDGQYVARTEKESNGHGYCEIRAVVDRVGEISDFERGYIFNTDCGSEVRVSWKGNRDLLITYSFNQEGRVRTYKSSMSNDKDVYISYELRPEIVQ